MLPALPTGSRWTSGASPRMSTISNDAVFCPCEAVGVDRVDERDRVVLGRARGRSQAVVEVAADLISWAPCTTAWASLPMAILPSGTSTAA